MDLLSPEQFEEGFGSHTPMITGQTRVVRYYPMFARAFPLMRQLINEQCNLSESSKDTISRATSCKDLYDVMRRDFWVVTSCESTSNPGTAHEGTRITLQVRRLHHSRERERSADECALLTCLSLARFIQYSAPEGYEFSIRTPGTPSRWAEYDKELEFVWNLLYEEAIKPDRDIERLSELILTLAFYWYNFMPLSRGTAACGYVAILSLFLSFDIWVCLCCRSYSSSIYRAFLTMNGADRIPPTTDPAGRLGGHPHAFTAGLHCYDLALDVCRPLQDHAVGRSPIGRASDADPSSGNRGPQCYQRQPSALPGQRH